jgi:ketosteroid isomerase-like protein
MMQFATPIEAEEAFYDAFSRCDLSAMMQVWLNAEHIECIHPAGPRLNGIDAVRESWAQMFSHGDTLQFQIIRHHCTQTGNLAIHSVSEQIVNATSTGQTFAQVLATNIYELSPQGWRMILHHASPARTMTPPDSTTMH